MKLPLKRMEPEQFKNPPIHLRSVVFPEPFSPARPKIVPFLTVKDMFFRIFL